MSSAGVLLKRSTTETLNESREIERNQQRRLAAQQVFAEGIRHRRRPVEPVVPARAQQRQLPVRLGAEADHRELVLVAAVVALVDVAGTAVERDPGVLAREELVAEADARDRPDAEVLDAVVLGVLRAEGEEARRDVVLLADLPVDLVDRDVGALALALVGAAVIGGLELQAARPALAPQAQRGRERARIVGGVDVAEAEIEVALPVRELDAEALEEARLGAGIAARDVDVGERNRLGLAGFGLDGDLIRCHAHHRAQAVDVVAVEDVEGDVRLDRLDVLRRDHEIALAVHRLQHDRLLVMDLTLPSSTVPFTVTRSACAATGTRSGEDGEHGCGADRRMRMSPLSKPADVSDAARAAPRPRPRATSSASEATAVAHAEAIADRAVQPGHHEAAERAGAGGEPRRGAARVGEALADERDGERIDAAEREARRAEHQLGRAARRCRARARRRRRRRPRRSSGRRERREARRAPAGRRTGRARRR